MRQVYDGKERDLTRGGLTDARLKGERSKACHEKSAEAIVPSKWSTGRAETYGGDAEGHQNDQAKRYERALAISP